MYVLMLPSVDLTGLCVYFALLPADLGPWAPPVVEEERRYDAVDFDSYGTVPYNVF